MASSLGTEAEKRAFQWKDRPIVSRRVVYDL